MKQFVSLVIVGEVSQNELVDLGNGFCSTLQEHIEIFLGVVQSIVGLKVQVHLKYKCVEFMSDVLIQYLLFFLHLYT